MGRDILELAFGAAEQRGAFARQIRDHNGDRPLGIDFRCGDPHARFRAPIRVVRHAAFQRRFLERPIALVQPQTIGRRVVGHVDVRSPVASEIRTEHTEPRSVRGADARGVRHIDELSVALVVEEPGRDGLVGHRRAVVRLTRRRVAALVALEGEVHVVRDEQIEIPVRIVVQERGARTPPRIVNSGCARHVGECAIAVAVEEDVVPDVGHVEIEEPVVVVIACRRTHSVAVMANAGFLGDVNEAQLSRLGQHVAKQPVPRLPVGWGREEQRPPGLQRAALDQIHIEIAVVVVVEEGGPGAHDFRHEVLTGRSGDVVEVETDLGGNLVKGRIGRRRDEPGRNERQREADESAAHCFGVLVAACSNVRRSFSMLASN